MRGHVLSQDGTFWFYHTYIGEVWPMMGIESSRLGKECRLYVKAQQKENM